AHDEIRLGALLGAGRLAFRLDYTQRSDEILSEAVTLARDLGDTAREADASILLATNRIWLGADAVEALAARGLTLAKAAGDAHREAHALLLLGLAAMLRADFAKAQSRCLESARLWESTGCMLRAPLAMLFAGESAFERLDFVVARKMLDDSLIQHRRMGNIHDAAQALRSLARLALNEGRLEEAAASCAESLRIFRSLHDPNCSGASASVQAEILFTAGDAAGALREAESAASLFRGYPSARRLVDTLQLMGRFHAALGDEAAARRALSDALAVQRGTDRD